MTTKTKAAGLVTQAAYQNTHKHDKPILSHVKVLISTGSIPRPLGRKLAESQRVEKAQLIPRCLRRGALFVALACRGLMPVKLADWIIQRGGLRHV